MAPSRLHDLSPTRRDTADTAAVAVLEAIRRFARAEPASALGTIDSAAGLPFRSFWMGGYAGADHVDSAGVSLDMARANGHLERLDEDYERAAALGLRTVRESLGWRLTETAPGRFDFTRLARIAEAARRHGLQVVWTLMNHGTPADVDLRDDGLIDRFARFAARVAESVAPLGDDPPVYNLIDDIGSLAGAVSETVPMHASPHRDPAGTVDSNASSGDDVKRRLVRAALAGIDAIRAIDRRARFLHIERLVHVVAPAGRPDLQPLADSVGASQWHVWDLLAGRAEPELGGSPDALDLLGVSHHRGGQWEVGTEEKLWWHRRDPRRRPLAALLDDAWRRYRRPLVIAATGHVGIGRTGWLHEVADEVARARAAAVPVGGICLSPLVDRPDRNDATHWHHGGLWDVEPASLRRLLHLDLAEVLADWQQRLPQARARLRRPLIVLADGRWRGLSGCLLNLLRHLATDRRVIVVEAGDAEGDADARSDGSAASAGDGVGDGDAGRADIDGPLGFGASAALQPPLPWLDRIVKGPRLEVLMPRTGARAPTQPASPTDTSAPQHTPAPAPESGPARTTVRRLAAALAAYLAAENIREADLWFAGPLADPQHWTSALGVRVGRVAYQGDHDWNGSAPDAWRLREAQLLHLADVVVTSSSLMAERLGALHPTVHWLPDAVDVERHAPEQLAVDCEEAAAVRRALQPIPTPRFGCIGAVDRTLDLGLVDALATRRPDWQIVMVGRIDPALEGTLPQRPNLHWLGRQPARRLPWFIDGCDVGLLPHATNAHPRSLCPQPLLEHLAAGRPVVATPLPDLLSSFGSCVRIADDPVSFVDACTAALNDSATTRTARAERVRAVLATRSWAANAQRVRWLLDRAAR